MLEARTQLALKVEETEGTAETLTVSEMILHSNGKFNPDTPVHQRPMRSSSLSPFASVPGARSASIEFDIELKGSGRRARLRNGHRRCWAAGLRRLSMRAYP